MNSDREAAWERDGRHVQWQLVHHIMELFARTHVAAEESASGDPRNADLLARVTGPRGHLPKLYDGCSHDALPSDLQGS